MESNIIDTLYREDTFQAKEFEIASSLRGGVASWHSIEIIVRDFSLRSK